MNLSSRFKPNVPSITYQPLEDGLVIAYLEKGIYYSLEPIGTFIWNELLHGGSIKSVLEKLCQRYDAIPHEIEHSFMAFIMQLYDEKLIVPQREIELTFSFFHPTHLPTYAKMPYHPPFLNKYTDMQELWELTNEIEVQLTV